MLPVDEILPALKQALRARTEAVLQAPPGAGKTTRVPLALLDEPWLSGRRIVMLVPRRLAARAAAAFMARRLGERVGQTVGYRVRMDTKVGPATRVEVVTEGVLTRLLQDDPSLEGVGLVIFDEFHERSLQADLGLALCLEARAALRDDLRVLVMSATLDGAAVARLLGDAPVLTSEGRSYPVETHYLEAEPQGRMEPVVAAAVRRTLRDEEGDVLVFLPGQAEIRRVERDLQAAGLPPDVRVLPLYGNLSQAEQEAAVAPGGPGRRKVVLATSIAETSLTIEGVRVVVDSGLMRVPRFSPRSGMTRLETIPVSKASADQRRGRAGRLGPGVCYRLWTRHRQQHLRPHSPPEIVEADLAPLALDLAAWGVADPAQLAWLDPPPPAAFAQARDLLAWLGALGRDGTITAHGRRMAELALHPRLAHMILKAIPLGQGPVACELAALLSERDVLRGAGGANADLRLRLELLRRPDVPDTVEGHPVDAGAVRHLRAAADHWKRRLGLPGRGGDVEACGLLLAFAYPDRIAQQRPGASGRFRLRNGRGAALAEPQLLSEASYLVAAELDGQHQESRIFLAAPVSPADLRDHFADQIETESVVTWDREARAVRARRRERLGAVVLRDDPWPDPDPNVVAEALVDAVATEGIDLLPWTKAARRVQERMVFVYHHDATWPDVSDAALRASVRDWLLPHVYGMRRADELQRLDLEEILLGRLSWEQRTRLDELAPSHVTVPSGSRIPVDYSRPEAPVLAVRLQELFGATDTPRVFRGAVPLTLHLLSPAHRPVQITQDLAGFWTNTYFDVRKDLRGRYPKHYWPDDPLQAEPTRRTKPRS